MPLDDLVFLSATDTTIGFVSQNRKILNRIKARPSSKPYIVALPSFSILKERIRVPRVHRKRVRSAVRQSFIFPNGTSFRIIRDARHLLLLKRLGWAYSTSANPAGKPYDPDFADAAADIVVEPLNSPRSPSKIFRLGKRKIRRIR